MDDFTSSMGLPEPADDESERSVMRRLVPALRAFYPDQLWVYRNELARLDPETGTIKPITRGAFRFLVQDALHWEVRTDEGVIKTKPSNDTIDNIYYGAVNIIPELKGIVRCPYWVYDSEEKLGMRIVARSGYEPASGKWLIWPSEQCWVESYDRELASEVINRLLDFDFGPTRGGNSTADKVHALGLFLLPMVRELIAGPTPLHLIVSGAAGAGKTYLAQITGAIFTGTKISPHATAEGGGELVYRLGPYLKEAPPFIFLDNLHPDTLTRSNEFKQIITSAVSYKTRLVRQGHAEDIPTRPIWMATGIATAQDQETARRTIPIHIRKRLSGKYLTPKLLEWILVEANREKVVTALMWLVWEWAKAGCPKPDRTLGSFEDWSDVVGGIICHNFPKFADAWLAEEHRPMPELDADMLALYRAWPQTHEANPDDFGGVIKKPTDPYVWWSARDIVDATTHSADLLALRELVTDKGRTRDQEHQVTIAGRFLREFAASGRSVGGFVLATGTRPRQTGQRETMYRPEPRGGAIASAPPQASEVSDPTES